MPRKPTPFSRIVITVVAMVAALALIQITRHGLQANDSLRGVSAQEAPACTSAEGHVEPPQAASRASVTPAVTLRLDYAGGEALINALERDSLSDADVDSLLGIRGLCAMVDNVPRFFPGIGVTKFRNEIREFVRTKKGGKYDGYFGLSTVWRTRAQVRGLISAIRADEPRIVAETISQLERYRPDTGALAITAYFVTGGVSDGFAFENDSRSLYANLARAEGDLNGVVLNMTHEAYHVMQFRAQERSGIVPLSAATDTTPPLERLFATTLAEGTASYVADPTRSNATGPDMERSRERFRRNAVRSRIARNFALFDDVLARLRDGRMTWDSAYKQGFTSENDAGFYFVGYEMTKAIERYCGRECIGRLFKEPPVEFFRRYIALYRAHPELAGRFSQQTEAVIVAYQTKPRQLVSSWQTRFMRLWTLHPRHLDAAGLVALWREALLAQAVLLGRTRGYTRHPQLHRFRSAANPSASIAAYLRVIAAEAGARGYKFNSARIVSTDEPAKPIAETKGQLLYEWEHLGRKLRRRSPAWYRDQVNGIKPTPHPLFRIVAGGVRDWEQRVRPGPR